MSTLLVPNKFPSKQVARRIAIIGEVPGTHEVHWHRCFKCGHGFATQWHDQRGWHKIEHCLQCFSRDIVSDPTPFCGPSGWLLNKLLAEVGIDRETCFVGNVCNVQPPANDITRFKWHGEEIQSGLAQLRTDLALYQPHFCLLLGGTPLRAFKGEGKWPVSDWRGSLFLASDMVPGVKTMATYHPAALLREAGLTREARADIRRATEESRTDELVVPEDVISIAWTKEQLLYALDQLRTFKMKVAVDIEGGCGAVSCIGFAVGANEAFVVPFIKADGTSYWSDPEDEVALWQAVSDVLTDPQVPKVLQNYLYDAFVLAWSYGILIRGLADDIMLKHFELSCESEKSLGYQTSIYTKHPFYKFERKSDDEKVQLTYCGKDCCRTFECNVAQNKLLMPKQREHYEFNVRLLTPLLYMELRGIRYDKDEAQRRLAATQKRIYALQDRINREAAASRPALAAFYAALEDHQQGDSRILQVTGGESGKCETRSGDDANAPGGLVALLTASFCLARRTEQRTVEETTYAPHFWNGKKWVKKGKRITQADFQAKVAEGWWQGTNAPGLAAGDKAQWWLKPVVKKVERNVAVEVTSLEGVLRFSKDSCKAECKRALRLCAGAALLTPAQRGELATLLGIHVKVNATNAEGDAQWFLYDVLGLEKQYKKEGNKLTDKLASDDEAILKAWHKSKRDRRAIWFLTLRRLVTATKALQAQPDNDGRIRCSYNLVGTETGRLACYGSPTGSSDLNLQTVTKGIRDLFKADNGYLMAQFDLSGSDTWSVAAYCAMLGDKTMLEDNLAGIKPAKVVALIHERGPSVLKLNRDELKQACKSISGDSMIYFACKRVVHGSDYGMGKVTMANQILTDSYKLTGKPIYIEPALCEKLQKQAFFVRYWGVPVWQQWMGRELKERGCLVASNGFKRNFYGRKDEHDTLKQALSHIPQVVTTGQTMTALLRVWCDPANRRENGSLVAEPLHTVHDSLLVQFPVDTLATNKTFLHSCFDNVVYIANTAVRIPAEGSFGSNWKHQQPI